MYQALYATTNYVLGNTITGGFSQTTLSNPQLTWESTYVTNVGIDYGFLNNRLTFGMDFYNKNTVDQLVILTSPAFDGNHEHG